MLTYRLLEINGDEYIYIFIILMETRTQQERWFYQEMEINGYWRNLFRILEKDMPIML